MGMRNNMWSPEEWADVVRLRAQGMTLRAVAARIGRTFHQLRHKIFWEEMTPEEREARAGRIKGYKRKYRETIKTERSFEMVRKEGRPTDESIADRERRHAAGPRDLTGAFFGDPPRGYSALERRA